MRFAYVCKAVDETSPFVATQVRWIRTLAAMDQVDRLWVITQKLGPADLPDNVEVAVIGPRPWRRRARRFLAEAARASREGAEFFLVVQGGPYPALLLPFKLLRRRPVYQWKAHSHVSWRMRFYARWCDDLLFTATPGSFPIPLRSRRVIGHGIDTELFRPSDEQPDRDLVAVTRIAPIKHLDQVVRALAACRETHGACPTFDIIGAVAPKDVDHGQALRRLVKDLGLEDHVRFLGVVPHHDLPAVLGRYRAAVNFSDTAFDKAAGEAMACGLPVVTTNPRAAEMMPADLRDRLFAPIEDTTAQVELLRSVTAWDQATRRQVGARLRETVEADHGLHSFFDKLLDEIEQVRPSA